jgi:hypothetical protein
MSAVGRTAGVNNVPPSSSMAWSWLCWEATMKNLLFWALAAAAIFCAYTHRPTSTEPAPVTREVAGSPAGNPVREIQRAPDTLMEMRDSMGQSNAGVANAARKAVTDTIGK